MRAADLRQRLDGTLELKDDVPGEHLGGFPPRTREEKLQGELFCIISDIILYLEDLEATPNRGDVDVRRLGGNR